MTRVALYISDHVDLHVSYISVRPSDNKRTWDGEPSGGTCGNRRRTTEGLYLPRFGGGMTGHGGLILYAIAHFGGSKNQKK